MHDTEGTIGQHQNKTYNSYQSRSTINPKTKDIYSKHHRMATHHWIIICGRKHHVQVGITAGCGRVDRVKEMRMVMMMVMLMKTITGDDSPPDGTPVPPRERRRGSPLCASSSMASPLDGGRFSLWSLAFMVMLAPQGSYSIASGDDGPLRQGAREGLD